MVDIVTLILAEHARIRRLFTELEIVADNPSLLQMVWAELAGCLQAHLDAAEEITYLPLFGDATSGPEDRRELADQDDDIREAMAEAHLQPTGSRLWRVAVRAARIAAEQRIDAMESGPLQRFRQQAPEHVQEALGHQWTRFMAAVGGDHQTYADQKGE